MNLLDFRRQYPQYDDVSDEDLANSLYSKYYSDLPKEDFFGRFLPKAEPKAEPAKPAFAEEVDAAAGQEYWTGAQATPEEQMSAAQPSIGLAEARQQAIEARKPSVTETLPAGAPLSERPLESPLRRPFSPTTDRTDALMLGLMAERSKEELEAKPPAAIPTIEAARQAEQQRIIDAALASSEAIVRARQKPTEEPVESSLVRETLDIPIGATKGAVSGVGMLVNLFGADSSAARSINKAEDYLNGLMSAQAQNDQKEIARIMKEAEGKGLGEEVKAAVRAISVAPVDFLSNALGTTAPTIIAGLGAAVLGAPALVASGAVLATGLGMGAGGIKGALYDETKKALMDSGLTEGQAEARAILAQQYVGDNADMIFTGAAVGGLASVMGVERSVIREISRRLIQRSAAQEAGEAVGRQAAGGVARSIALGGLAEGAPETIQAAQEKFASNLAVRREGLERSLTAGVAGAATLEGLVGLGLGSGVSAVTARSNTPAAIVARSLEEGRFGEVTVPPSASILRPETITATTAPFERAEIPVPVATRTIEQVRDEVQATQDLDSAVETAARLVDEVKVARAPAEPELTEQQLLAGIETAVLGGPAAVEAPARFETAPPAAPAPAVTVPPAAPAVEGALEGRVEAAPAAVTTAPAGLPAAPIEAAPVTTEAPAAPTAPAITASPAEAVPAPAAPAPAPAAPVDFTAPRDIPSRGIAKGEVVTFPTEKQAVAYAREQKLEGFEPREVEDGFVLSRAAAAPTAPTAAPTAAPAPTAPNLVLKEGQEYESRLFGGSYSPERLRGIAKDAPIRKMIPAARERYNNIRTSLGLEPVSNWNVRPENSIESLARGASIAPATATEAPAAPRAAAPTPATRVVNFTAPRDIPSRKVKAGEVVSFTSQKQAIAFAAENNLEGFAPRKEGKKWVLSQGEQRAIQEPSAEALPVREGAEGRQRVGERDTQREEIAGEGRVGEARPEVVDFAERKFGNRVAPNGRPVKENFARFFKASKVVDEKGEPLVVYHGTTRKEDFSVFNRKAADRSRARIRIDNAGSWFSSDIEQANIFAGAPSDKEVGTIDDPRSGARVIPTYLNISNPLEIDSYQELERIWNFYATTDEQKNRWTELNEKENQTADDRKEMFDLIRGDPDLFVANLEKEGIDGLKLTKGAIDAFKGTDPNGVFWVAFRPEQIKSAVGNNGNFGAETGQIAEQVYGPQKSNLDPSNEEAKVVQDGVEGKSAIEAAEWLAENAPNGEQRLLAEKIAVRLRELEFAGVEFELKVAHVGDKVPAKLTRARGIIDYSFEKRAGRTSGRMEIWVNGADVTDKVGTSFETVLHELLHGATMAAVRLGKLEPTALRPELARAMKRLYDVHNAIAKELNSRADRARAGTYELTEFEKETLGEDNNAFRNLDETIAWALTNKGAQAWLESVEYKGTKRSMWSEFVMAFRSFLGLSPKADTALSEVLSVTEALLETPVEDLADIAAEAGTMLQVTPTKEGAEEIVEGRRAVTPSDVIAKIRNKFPQIEDAEAEVKVEDRDGGIAESIKAKPGANVQRMAKLLGPKLYGDPKDLATVSVKEMFQNSFDAIKGLDGKVEGKIEILVDDDERTISITDNGKGMTSNVLANQFLQIAGTYKETERASGGLGIAKMLFLFANEDIEVQTLRGGKLSSLKTTGPNLFAAMEDDNLSPNIDVVDVDSLPDGLQKTLIKERFPDGSGTFVQVRVPRNYTDNDGNVQEIKLPFNSYSFDVLNESPLFENIEVKFNGRTLPIGSKFPAQRYDNLFQAKFEWGTANVYVEREENSSEKYGSNLRVLSNGLWQFSDKLKEDPTEYWGDNIKRAFYIDASPSVPAEDSRYPFDLNRQKFSTRAQDDINVITGYLNSLYRNEKLAQQSAEFGSVYVLEKDNGVVGVQNTIELKPKLTEETISGKINKKDEVEVRDGVLTVNGKQVPVMTRDMMKQVKVDVDNFKVDQSLIPSNSVSVHNNIEVNFRSDEWMDFVEWAQGTYGAQFNEMNYEIGEIFIELRNAAVETTPDLDGLQNTAIGISFDREYRGVSLAGAPFSGMFVNPLATQYEDPARAASGIKTTMIHEMAHYRIRSHNAEFASEMQRIWINLDASYDLSGATQRLRQVFEKHDNMLRGLRAIFESSDRTRPIGKSLEGKSYERIDEQPDQGRGEDRDRQARPSGDTGRVGGAGERPRGEQRIYRGDGDRAGKAQPERVAGEVSRDVGRPSQITYKEKAYNVMNDVIRKYQDRMVDLGDYIKEYQKANGQLPEAFNPYRLENLFSSKVAVKSVDFLNNEVRPLLKLMGKLNVKMSELEAYLHARHAPYRNEVMAERNLTQAQIDQRRADIESQIAAFDIGSQEIKEGGERAREFNRLIKERDAWAKAQPFQGTEEQRLMLSGMSTKDANEYIANIPDNKKAKLERIAAKVDAIIDGTREMLEGVTDPAGAFNDRLKFYVPLKREGFEDRGGGFSSGFSVKGMATRAATGSTRGVIDIFANIVAQRDAAIHRVESNKIAAATLGLALTSPNPDFWQIDTPVKEPAFDKKTGTVVMRTASSYRDQPNVIVAKVPDGKGGIVERSVVFNPENDEAMNIADALRKIDLDSLTGVYAAMAPITRWFSVINTKYSPLFGFNNFRRDLQSAMIQASSSGLKGGRLSLVAGAIEAFPQLIVLSMAESAGMTLNTETAKLYKEFREEGGETFRFRDMWIIPAERAKLFEKELNRAAATGGKKGAIIAFKALKFVTADLVSALNLAFENSIRVSAYKLAREQGKGKTEAAEISKNVTVNFDRRGTKTAQMGALFSFFNSAVQGNKAVTSALGFKWDKGGIPSIGAAGATIIGGGVLLGILQAAILAAAGYEEDEVAEKLKQRNFIIPLKLFGEKLNIDSKYVESGYYKIPLAFGYNFFVSLGRIPTEFALGGYKDPGKKSFDLFTAALDAYNPLGSGTPFEMAVPTAAKPLVSAFVTNKDWMGKNIAIEQMDPLSQEPGYRRAKATASNFGIMVAKGINSTLGGTEYTASPIFSPTPDQIDYLVAQITGGPGREVKKVDELIQRSKTGEEIPANRIPFVSLYYGEVGGQAGEYEKFYNNIKLLNKHKAEIEGRRKRADELKTVGEPMDAEGEIAMYKIENPSAAALDKLNHQSVLREVQNITKEKREAIRTAKQLDSVEADIMLQNKVFKYDFELNRIMSTFNSTMQVYKDLDE